MLQQLQKLTITQSELSGASKREKRFIGTLLAAAATVGSLFSLGVSAVNSVQLSTVRRPISELQTEIPEIQEQINQQQEDLRTVGKTLQGTILVLNSQSNTLSKTLGTVICGLQTMTKNSQCPTTITPRHKVTTTQAEIVGNLWLVSTPAKTATLTYEQHDTSSHVELPSQALWISVLEGAILHINDVALYHPTNMKVSDFFSKHVLKLDEQTLTKIQFEGPQTVDVTPIDNMLQEMEVRSRRPIQPLAYAWSSPDSAIAAFIGLGYLLTFAMTLLFIKRYHLLQYQFARCTERLNKLSRRKRQPHETTANDLMMIETEEHPNDNQTPQSAILELVDMNSAN